MAVALRSALYVSMHDLADAQTVAYGGSWTSSATKLAQICHVQSVDLGLSVVAFDRQLPVGIALVGRRADHGWLHDIAVAPTHRGSGLGTQIMEGVLEEMRQQATREIELDVAAMRSDAIGLYTRLGFRTTRTYLNLAASATDLGLDQVELQPGHALVAGSEGELIEAYARAQQVEPLPCWDRSLASLLAYPDGYISRLMAGDHEIGLMHYLARPAASGDPDRLRPLFLRLAPEAGADELAELLAATARAAFGEVQGLAIRVALEPEASACAMLLDQLRMPVVAESFDMRLAL